MSAGPAKFTIPILAVIVFAAMLGWLGVRVWHPDAPGRSATAQAPERSTGEVDSHAPKGATESRAQGVTVPAAQLPKGTEAADAQARPAVGASSSGAASQAAANEAAGPKAGETPAAAAARGVGTNSASEAGAKPLPGKAGASSQQAGVGAPDADGPGAAGAGNAADTAPKAGVAPPDADRHDEALKAAGGAEPRRSEPAKTQAKQPGGTGDGDEAVLRRRAGRTVRRERHCGPGRARRHGRPHAQRRAHGARHGRHLGPVRDRAAAAADRIAGHLAAGNRAQRRPCPLDPERDGGDLRQARPQAPGHGHGAGSADRRALAPGRAVPRRQCDRGAGGQAGRRDRRGRPIGRFTRLGRASRHPHRQRRDAGQRAPVRVRRGRSRSHRTPLPQRFLRGAGLRGA